MNTELAVQTALVTGGGGGIGRAVVRALAKAGVRVVVVDICRELAQQVAQELEEEGQVALPLSVDVSHSRAVEEMVRQTLERFGAIDVLVNCAGIMSNCTVVELSEAEWDKVIAVNLKGTFLCCQRVAREMMGQKSGRIINIASTAGQFGGAPGQAAYAASKIGVVGLTKVLAVELGPYGITANAVCPANVNTEMLQRAFADRAKLTGTTAESIVERIAAVTPLRRLAEPEDIADVVVFLASRGARYITGQAIAVCGGRTTQVS